MTLAALLSMLVVGVWLIDYAGRVRLAQVEVVTVAHELAYELADLYQRDSIGAARKAASAQADRRLARVCDGRHRFGYALDGGYVVVRRRCDVSGASPLFEPVVEALAWVACPGCEG